MNKYLFAILLPLVLSLSACETEKTYTVKTEDEQPAIIIPEPPPQMKFQSVHWYVVTIKSTGVTVTDRLEAFVKALKAKQQNNTVVFFAIVPKHYENLGLNNQEMKRYIDQQRSIIEYFKQYLAEKNGSTATTTK